MNRFTQTRPESETVARLTDQIMRQPSQVEEIVIAHEMRRETGLTLHPLIADRIGPDTPVTRDDTFGQLFASSERKWAHIAQERKAAVAQQARLSTQEVAPQPHLGQRIRNFIFKRPEPLG